MPLQVGQHTYVQRDREVKCLSISNIVFDALVYLLWFHSQAYIYDIRSSRYLHKLHRHSDTVLRVAFNPATPEVRIVSLTRST